MDSGWTACTAALDAQGTAAAAGERVTVCSPCHMAFTAGLGCSLAAAGARPAHTVWPWPASSTAASTMRRSAPAGTGRRMCGY